MTRARSIANIGAAVDGGLFFRNRIINGSALIAQRGTVPSTAVQAIYGTDRMVMGSVAGTGIGLNLLKSTFGGSSSGLGHLISGSMTNGLPYWAQRIEAANVFDLNNNYVTISGLLYQNTGSTQNFVVRLSRANAVDNFTGVTQIAQGAAFAVPDNTVVPFSATFLLGATDASNGLMPEVFSVNPITCTSKTFAIADFQLEKGSAKTPFEVRPIGTELMMCQRYYETGGNWQLYSGYVVSGEIYYNPVRFSVTKRAAPLVIPTYAATSRFPTSAPAAQAISADGFWASASANLTGTGYFQYTWTASAEL